MAGSKNGAKRAKHDIESVAVGAEHVGTEKTTEPIASEVEGASIDMEESQNNETVSKQQEEEELGEKVERLPSSGDEATLEQGVAKKEPEVGSMPRVYADAVAVNPAIAANAGRQEDVKNRYGGISGLGIQKRATDIKLKMSSASKS